MSASVSDRIKMIRYGSKAKQFMLIWLYSPSNSWHIMKMTQTRNGIVKDDVTAAADIIETSM